MFYRQARGQVFGPLDREGRIELTERLQGHRRAGTAEAVENDRRGVKRLEHRQDLRPPLVEIDAPPPRAGLIFGNDDLSRAVARGWNIGTKHPLIEIAAGGEHAVPNR